METDNSNSSHNTWLVIDSRTAKLPNHSSISRFTYGLIQSVVKNLSEKKSSHSFPFKNFKLLLISNAAPSQWILDLIEKYPEAVSYWCGGPGALQKSSSRFSWLWPTKVLKRIQKITEDRFVWISPGNLDRPLFISNTPLAKRIIQVLHDPTPFLNVPGFNLFYKFHFKWLVKRSLNNLSNLMTTSHYSHEIFMRTNKKKSPQIFVINDAVDKIFGNKKRIATKIDLWSKRKDFFISVIETDPFSNDKNNGQKKIFLNLFQTGTWCLGIGKYKKYKNWDVAQSAILKLTNKENENLNIWFIRLGWDQKELNSYLKKSEILEFGPIKVLPNLKTVLLPRLSDLQLLDLYLYSDINLCPSIAEGFGLSTLESAFCGTPTIFKSGTAIDDHFKKEALPSNFWCKIDSSSPAIWANQIERFIHDKKDSEFYKELFSSENPRNYITQYSISPSFNWEEQSENFIDFLFQKNGIVESID